MSPDERDARPTKKFVDAIAPCRRQPIFTAIKRVRANVRHTYTRRRPAYGEQVGKILLYVAYVVETRTSRPDRSEEEGDAGRRQRENDLVACRANWPWSFLIRSIYRTCRVFRPLSISPFLPRTYALVSPLSRSFVQQDAVLLEMKCREFINLYLPPKAFYMWTSIPNYIILEQTIDELLCALRVFAHFKRIFSALLFESPVYLFVQLK